MQAESDNPHEATRSEAAAPSRDSYDVIIIGGGPAGSTCATLLAREGRKVLVLEREVFPRFRIGESLTAFAASAFKELGVYEELKKINHVRKKGLDFVLPDGTSRTYLFPDDESYGDRNEPGELPWAFQMERSKLDTVLLRNAERNGAEVREGQAVGEIVFEHGRAVGVTLKRTSNGNGALREIRGRWIVDTSGQAGLINRQLKDNCIIDALLDDKLSVFNHFDGNLDIQNGDAEANFKLCVHPNGRDWAWYLPVDRNRVSVGVVVDRASMKERGGSLEEFFYTWTRDIPFIRELLQRPDLKPAGKFRGMRDYSYRSRKYFGPGWVMTGDAAAFLDPIFSTGMQLAFTSAFKLAEILNRLLEQDEPDDRLLEAYAASLERIYRIDLTLVYWFYQNDLDPDEAAKPLNVWRRTQWASFSFRLRFLWLALQILIRGQAILGAWAREVFFGHVKEGNKLADLCLVLADNYEAVHAEKFSSARVRDFSAA